MDSGYNETYMNTLVGQKDLLEDFSACCNTFLIDHLISKCTYHVELLLSDEGKG